MSEYGRALGKSFEGLKYAKAGPIAMNLINANMSMLCGALA